MKAWLEYAPLAPGGEVKPSANNLSKNSYDISSSPTINALVDNTGSCAKSATNNVAGWHILGRRHWKPNSFEQATV